MGTQARNQQQQDDEDLPPEDVQEQAPEDAGVTIDIDQLERTGRKKEEGDTVEGGDGEDADGGLAQADPDPTRAARRREERKARKEERVRRERQIEAENEELRTRVASLEENAVRGRMQDVRSTLENIDTEMSRLQNTYTEARRLKAEAYEKQDGKAVVDADEAMDAARERFNQLNGERARIITAVRQEQSRPQVSETLTKGAEAFMKDHDWYDMNGRDRDSAAVLAIDRKMANDGWDPNKPGYWEELRERVQEELPHRFERGGRRDGQRDDDQPPQRQQRTGGSGREGSPGSNTYFLSAARVRALKEAGMWDDPKQRAKMIKIYRDRDAQEARKSQRR